MLMYQNMAGKLLGLIDNTCTCMCISGVERLEVPYKPYVMVTCIKDAKIDKHFFM